MNLTPKITPKMQEAIDRLEMDGEIRKGTGVALGTVRALERRNLATVVKFTETRTQDGKTWDEDTWIAYPVRQVTVITEGDIEYTEDGDYVRDSDGNCGTTFTRVYEISGGVGFMPRDLSDIITEVVDIITSYGATQYSSYPDWERLGWYAAETYRDPCTDRGTDVSVHLSGFTAEESRAIHAVITTDESAREEFARAAIDTAITTLLWSDVISTPEDGDPGYAGYSEAMRDRDGDPFDQHYSLDDLDESVRNEIAKDVRDFISSNWGIVYNLDAGQVGHGFIMSRNGHGVGFWEHDYGTKRQCDALQSAAERYGAQHLDMGPDGTVYVTG